MSSTRSGSFSTNSPSVPHRLLAIFFAECLNLVVAAANGVCKAAGLFVRDPADLPHYLGLGFTQIAIDSDLPILRRAGNKPFLF